ncbi:MAG TPA: hypothetical protein VMY78_02525 [Solirubrobacteraceae bacterium]|nr:hypothetical protein [Solirubrobacteraceae bacterium]
MTQLLGDVAVGMCVAYAMTFFFAAVGAFCEEWPVRGVLWRVAAEPFRWFWIASRALGYLLFEGSKPPERPRRSRAELEARIAELEHDLGIER